VTIISSQFWSSFQQRWFPEEEEELGIVLETLKLASRSFLLSLSRDSFSLSLSLSRALLLFLETFCFLGVLGLVLRLSPDFDLARTRITSSWKPLTRLELLLALAFAFFGSFLLLRRLGFGAARPSF
jgi:hypothetical protein